MVRHADMEMIDTEEDVYTHRSLEAGGTACHAGPHKEALGSSGGRNQGEESMFQSLYQGFCRKAWVRQGRHSE